jgi:hypothetical protein
MPTVIFKNGWRLYFYMNEQNEPPHIHASKGDTECKFWLKIDEYEIEEAHIYNLSAAQRRQVRKLIFENFEYIVDEYRRLHSEQNWKTA